MAILDSIGTGIQSGAAPSTGTWTNYIVQSVTEGNKNVEIEDVFDADGALVTRLVFLRHAKLSITAVCKTAATPATDFPVGDMSALTGLTAFYVDGLSVNKVKGATQITVELTNIGIT